MNNHPKLSAQGQIKYALEIITNLQFISLLEPGDKFYTSDRSICKPSFYDRIIRTFSGENRELMYSYIDNHVINAISFIDTADMADRIMISYVRDILTMLDKSNKGLQSLKETYKYDRIYCIRLDTIADLIRKTIERYTTQEDIYTPTHTNGIPITEQPIQNQNSNIIFTQNSNSNFPQQNSQNSNFIQNHIPINTNNEVIDDSPE